MNKINGKLLTAFLILGIGFFLIMIYMFLVKEILPTSNHNIHTVNLNSIKILKNGFLDTSKIDRRERNDETYYGNNSKQNCIFSLVNNTDKLVYANSSKFDITTLVTPNSMDFYSNSLIPQSSQKDKYQLILKRDNKIIVTFLIDNFYGEFNLGSKTDNSTEHREIKLSSPDKNLTVFLSFTID